MAIWIMGSVNASYCRMTKQFQISDVISHMFYHSRTNIALFEYIFCFEWTCLGCSPVINSFFEELFKGNWFNTTQNVHSVYQIDAHWVLWLVNFTVLTICFSATGDESGLRPHCNFFFRPLHSLTYLTRIKIT